MMKRLATLCGRLTAPVTRGGKQEEWVHHSSTKQVAEVVHMIMALCLSGTTPCVGERERVRRKLSALLGLV